MNKALLGLCAVSLALQGCSTIIYGKNQELPVKTTPPGLSARVGTTSCITPCTLEVARTADIIYLGKDGNETKYELEKSTNIFTYFFGNILFAVFPGMILDGASGGKNSIAPVDIQYVYSKN